MIEARLPAHYERQAIDVELHEPWLIASLLEEGDSADLRWLLGRFGPERLRQWVETRGARQLSGRSLAFWRLVLEVEVAPVPGAGALWSR